jgi:hypothetical protein
MRKETHTLTAALTSKQLAVNERRSETHNAKQMQTQIIHNITKVGSLKCRLTRDRHQR